MPTTSLREKTDTARFLPNLDVLFVDLPFNTYELGRRFKAAWSHKQLLNPYELHLGFRYMVSALQSQGYAGDIIFPAQDTGLKSRTDLIRVIAQIQPKILGFTSYEGTMREVLSFIRQAKSKGVQSLICMGGHLATCSYEEILRDFHDLIDVIVLGEGEHTIVDLASAVRRGEEFSTIPGLAYFVGNQVVVTERRPPEPDINRFTFPVLMSAKQWDDNNAPLFLTTSRGCYAHCTFCRSSLLNERWRARDPDNVVDEIERACRQGVSIFEIVDDNFLGPGTYGKKRALAIAQEIKNRGLRIRFHASCRVNDVDESTMLALKDAGLISVSLGVESGVQRVLDTFNKKITPEQSIATLDLLNQLNIPTLAYIIFFDPYMNLDEVQANLKFLQRIRSLDNVRFEEIIFRKLIPISGTPIFEQIKQDSLLRGDYLNGHYFTFRDRRVAILADFMESLDLRFERLFSQEPYRHIDGLYSFCKEIFEVSFAAKASDLLSATRWKKVTVHEQMNLLLRNELRSIFGADLAATNLVTVD